MKEMSLEDLHEKYKFLEKMDKDNIADLIRFIMIGMLEREFINLGDFLKDCSSTLSKN